MSLVGRAGYKETSIGWIPEAWPLRRLEAITTSNITYGVVQPGPEDANGVRLVRGGDVKSGRVSSALRTISGAVSSQFSRTVLRGGELLVSLVGYPGETAIAGKDLAGANIARQVGLVRLCESNDSHFIQQYLSSPVGKKVLLGGMIGSAQQVINLNALREVEVPLPPLPEQQKIAAILTSVDDKLDVIARQVEAIKSLKRGLMQTLFSRGVGTQDADGRWVPHANFKDSELGEIPAGWVVGTVGSYVAALCSGVSVNAEDRTHDEGEVGVLKVSCVFNGQFRAEEHKTVLPNEVTRISEPVEQGRIIISRANTPALVGESAYVEASRPDLFLPDKLWQTKATDVPHSVKWLAYYLQSPFARQEISKAASGTSGSMKNISKTAFLGVPMPLVPLVEQEQVAAVLTAVTSKLTGLIHKHTHYQTLKRGLMQKLLTGEWRVSIDATATGT